MPSTSSSKTHSRTSKTRSTSPNCPRATVFASRTTKPYWTSTRCSCNRAYTFLDIKYRCRPTTNTLNRFHKNNILICDSKKIRLKHQHKHMIAYFVGKNKSIFNLMYQGYRLFHLYSVESVDLYIHRHRRLRILT